MHCHVYGFFFFLFRVVHERRRSVVLPFPPTLAFRFAFRWGPLKRLLEGGPLKHGRGQKGVLGARGSVCVHAVEIIVIFSKISGTPRAEFFQTQSAILGNGDGRLEIELVEGTVAGRGRFEDELVAGWGVEPSRRVGLELRRPELRMPDADAAERRNLQEGRGTPHDQCAVLRSMYGSVCCCPRTGPLCTAHQTKYTAMSWRPFKLIKNASCNNKHNNDDKCCAISSLSLVPPSRPPPSPPKTSSSDQNKYLFQNKRTLLWSRNLRPLAHDNSLRLRPLVALNSWTINQEVYSTVPVHSLRPLQRLTATARRLRSTRTALADRAPGECSSKMTSSPTVPRDVSPTKCGRRANGHSGPA